MLKTLFALDEACAPDVPVQAVLPSNEELGAECLARAGIYRLLSAAFIEEPGRAFVAALREPDALAALAEAGVAFGPDFTAPELDELLECLACEYGTLFTASGGFPPMESVRLTGRYKQEPHFAVSQTYARAGFALGRGRFEVFPDQLGVELMFIAELLERSAAALDAGDAREAARLERDIKRFWTQHPGRWVRGYGRLIARAAEHSFYREMARLLTGFAEDEIAAMRLRIEDLDEGREVVPKQEIRVEFNPDEPVCNGCAQGTGDARLPTATHPLRDLR
ncbi:MAG TPA: molecular chaperone TorD family protein [Aromatoleum sp.]|uniref:TorD/DmsD family molecular chaperone n=1 Tax=Aromatoleum sp. TaxID=2307007 RepID=UPI002B485D76|nr:molecular chaperone TorD family protein [Aromatoleum sp.]HJV24442.1 molecular chaperone TorD family protein [Aromatoleum sp.]